MVLVTVLVIVEDLGMNWAILGVLRRLRGMVVWLEGMKIGLKVLLRLVA